MELGRITTVTIATPDLDKVIDVYSKYLGYRLSSRSIVTHDQALNWNALKTEGAEMIYMQPEGSNDFSFRFVKQNIDSDYIPFGTFGWNAAELIVKNVDESATRLLNSPFEVIGKPADLSFTDQIRAMQILGPSKEILYLTQFKSKLDEFDSPQPRCDIDQTFIVILAGENLEEMQTFLHEKLSIQKAPLMESRIRAISKVFGLSEETKYKSTALAIRDQSLIELDQMPAEASKRNCIPGFLPTGISIVSFLAYDAENELIKYNSNIPNIEKNLASTLHGSSGELIELIYI